MAYDMTGDSTGDHLTFPRDSYERDRLRIQRELDRDLNHPSYSSDSMSGLENVGRPYLDDDETGLSFNFEHDPRATVTRRVNLLDSSPDINSRMLAAEFADFSMAGNDLEDEIEIGRGKNNNNNDMRDFSPPKRPTYSLRGTASSRSKRLSDAYASAGRSASPSLRPPRHQNISALHSDTTEYHSVRTKNQSPIKGKENNKAITDEQTGTMDFDLSKATHHSTPKKNQNIRQPSESSSGGKPRKTTEQVSSTEKKRFPSYQARVQEDDASSVASEDLEPIRTRKQRTDRLSSLKGTSAPSLKSAMAKAAETMEATQKRKASRSDVPKSFKSTEAFIQELGLDGHTATINLHHQLQKPQPKPLRDEETIDLGNQDPSFLLPQISGISELINAEATRLYQNSTFSQSTRKKPNHLSSHMPIESIPIPEDNRAILMAMQLLQEKMTGLEQQKVINDRRCDELKEQLKTTKKKYEAEYARAKVAEAEIERRKRIDRDMGISEKEADRKAAEQEKVKATLMAEKTQLEETVEHQKTQMEYMTHHLDITRTVLRNMQEERNDAVQQAASAIASQEDLKRENQQLRSEIQVLRAGTVNYDSFDVEREAWKAKEEKLRKRIERARDAEAMVKGDCERLLRKLEQHKEQKQAAATPQSSVTEKIQEATIHRACEGGMSELVRKELEKMRPDLFPPAATTATAATVPAAKAKRSISSLKPSTSAPGITILKNTRKVSQPEPTVTTSSTWSAPVGTHSRTMSKKKSSRRVTVNENNHFIEPPASPSAAESEPAVMEREAQQDEAGNETVYTINGDYIRRIADEIDEERKRRKAAEKKAVAAVAEMKKLAQGSEAAKATSSTVTTATTTEPTSTQHQAAQITRPASVPPAASTEQVTKPRRRRVKKVVYYEEGDTTEIIPEQLLAASLKTALAEKPKDAISDDVFATAVATPLPEAEKSGPVASSSESEVEPVPLKVPRRRSSKSTTTVNGSISSSRKNTNNTSEQNRKSSTSSVEAVDDNALPKPPVLPDHIQQVIDIQEHDAATCTVCARREHQGVLDPDQSIAAPTPFVVPVSEQQQAEKRIGNLLAGKPGTFEEGSTIRPSQPPKKQLSRVVRQLQDEFVHLKMSYQEKAEEFLSLDPSRGKRRRKAITLEINEMVEEMDYKCDQIYALYDVAEEVAAKRRQQRLHMKPVVNSFLGRFDPNLMSESEEEHDDHEANHQDGDDERELYEDEERGEEETGPVLTNGHVDEDETASTSTSTEDERERGRKPYQQVNVEDIDTTEEIGRHLHRIVVADTYEEGDSTFL